MTVGLAQDKAAVDARTGQLAFRAREVLQDIVDVNAWLGSLQDADLTALGYTQDEVNTLRAAFLALHKLSDVAFGLDTVQAPDNFFFNANKLIGPHT